MAIGRTVRIRKYIEDGEKVAAHQRLPKRSPRQIVDLTPLDLDLFQEQRCTLRSLIEDERLDKETIHHLQGIESLLDHIYDELVPVDIEADK